MVLPSGDQPTRLVLVESPESLPAALPVAASQSVRSKLSSVAASVLLFGEKASAVTLLFSPVITVCDRAASGAASRRRVRPAARTTGPWGKEREVMLLKGNPP